MFSVCTSWCPRFKFAKLAQYTPITSIYCWVYGGYLELVGVINQQTSRLKGHHLACFSPMPPTAENHWVSDKQRLTEDARRTKLLPFHVEAWDESIETRVGHEKKRSWYHDSKENPMKYIEILFCWYEYIPILMNILMNIGISLKNSTCDFDSHPSVAARLSGVPGSCFPRATVKP
jgi:hypothetical protein